MLKIDIHTHILPPSLPNYKNMFGYDGFIQLQNCPGCTDIEMLDASGKVFRRVQQNCFDPTIRMQECEPRGVRVQVLSTVPVMFCYWAKPQDTLTISQHLNNHIADIVNQHPTRFVGLGTVPMQDPALAVKELERCIKELKLRGVQIGSHVNDKNLSDPCFFEFYAACESLGAAIFVHPWDMMGQDRMGKYWLPWLVGMPAETSLAICSMIFGGIFSKFPNMRVAFAHGGGSFPFTLGRIQHGFDCRPDLCAIDCNIPPKEYTGHFYVDSLVHDARALKYLIDIIGVEKICLGTDYPFPLGETIPGSLIEQVALNKTMLEWMNYKAALNWLDMQKNNFD